MLSMAGVGMTPPNVLGTPKPASSVIIRRTFGAPAGGTMRGAHQGFDCKASSLMTPPNVGSGGGSCLPVIVVVALGEPSSPVTVCPTAPEAKIASAEAPTKTVARILMAAPLTVAHYANAEVRVTHASEANYAKSDSAALQQRATLRDR